MSREAIIAAAVSAAGSAILLFLGALLNHLTSSARYRRQQIAEKEKRRAEKFEELIAVLFEFNQWLDTLGNIYLFGRNIEEPISPLPRADAIAAVYFPSFRKKLLALDQKSNAYYLWLLQRAQLRLAGKSMDEVCAGRGEQFTPYYQLFLDLIDDLHDFADREFR
ncbi:MAG: hypothetical protein BGN89_10975 [Alphaproteobacteria bacterium 64-6]|nr:MAG: hypothetical protein BGN89_10975 [Alphaproteobacteria bacterium 64-6]